jgi:hypothetical protein
MTEWVKGAIRLRIGLLGTKKTWRALTEAKAKARFVVYTPLRGSSYGDGGHPLLKDVARIPSDTWLYLKDGLTHYFRDVAEESKRGAPCIPNGFYIPFSGSSTLFFMAMKGLKRCSVVLDDFTSLWHADKENIFVEQLLPRMLWSGIDLTVTAHLPKEPEIPFELRHKATEIFIHGPMTGKSIVEALWERASIPIKREFKLKAFEEKLENLSEFEIFRVR